MRALSRRDRSVYGCDYCAEAITQKGKETGRAMMCKHRDCIYQIDGSFLEMCNKAESVEGLTYDEIRRLTVTVNDSKDED